MLLTSEATLTAGRPGVQPVGLEPRPEGLPAAWSQDEQADRTAMPSRASCWPIRSGPIHWCAAAVPA